LVAGAGLVVLFFSAVHHITPHISGIDAYIVMAHIPMVALCAYTFGKVANDAETIEYEDRLAAERQQKLESLSSENAALRAQLEALKEAQPPSALGATIACDDLTCDATKVEQAPLATRERNSLLLIVAALAKEADIDLSEPYKAARVTVNIADQLGVKVSENTVASHFKRVPEALGSRSQ
jgi:hypothetical protein